MDASLVNNIFAIGRVTPEGIRLSGTGFAVASDAIATAAHVATADDRGLVLVFPKVGSLLDYQDTTDNQVRSAPLQLKAYDPITDIAILSFAGTITFSYGLAGADFTPPGTTVTSLGFPHTDLGRLVLTQHTSTVGARIILGASGVKTKHIVLNTQARPGQSGSPVFGPSKRDVCAMIIGSFAPPTPGAIIAGIDPATLHQTTHAISAEYITAML